MKKIHIWYLILGIFFFLSIWFSWPPGLIIDTHFFSQSAPGMTENQYHEMIENKFFLIAVNIIFYLSALLFILTFLIRKIMHLYFKKSTK